jgi:hypothetical protein
VADPSVQNVVGLVKNLNGFARIAAGAGDFTLDQFGVGLELGFSHHVDDLVASR